MDQLQEVTTLEILVEIQEGMVEGKQDKVPEVTADLKGKVKVKMSKKDKPHLKHPQIKDNLEMEEQPMLWLMQQRQAPHLDQVPVVEAQK